MKIWITISSAGGLWSRGMRSLQVWFEKPVFVESEFYDPADIPFDSEDDGSKGFYSMGGWEIRKAGQVERSSVSLGSAFLFGEDREEDPRLLEIREYVWEEVCKHYGNKPLGKAWEDREKEGLSKIGDFILELDISISMNSAKHLHINGNSS
jgi:hypothetical protein